MMAVAGLVFLVLSLRLLLAGESVLRLALLLGITLPPVGGYFAVRFALQAYRLAAAERAYQVRRSEIHVENCPRKPERTPAGDSRTAEEDAAGNYLLDQD